MLRILSHFPGSRLRAFIEMQASTTLIHRQPISGWILRTPSFHAFRNESRNKSTGFVMNRTHDSAPDPEYSSMSLIVICEVTTLSVRVTSCCDKILQNICEQDNLSNIHVCKFLNICPEPVLLRATISIACPATTV